LSSRATAAHANAATSAPRGVASAASAAAKAAARRQGVGRRPGFGQMLLDFLWRKWIEMIPLLTYFCW